MGVIDVAERADRGAAGALDEPELTGRQLEERLRALLRHQLHRRAGAAAELRAAAGTHLDVVHGGAERNLTER